MTLDFRSKQARADVTPVRQRTQFSCMATSMCMALQSLGHKCDEDEVNQVMGATPTRGAAWEQALATAQHYGVRATLTTPSTITQLKSWTDAKKPVMIAWNPEGRDWSHASCVFDVTEGLLEVVPGDAVVQGSGPGLYVWVADSNIPHPEKLVRIVHEDFFYSKWYEKWPRYLVRRPALMLEREITPGGRQVMARVAGRWAKAQGENIMDKRAYEIYVDENGMAHDDEGNSWPAPGYSQGTYGLRDGPRPRAVDHWKGKPRRAPARVNQAQLDAMNQLLAKRPNDRFLKSIRDQVAQGRKLSEKQQKIVRQNMYKNGLKPLADHFRTAAQRVATRYLEARRASFEEWVAQIPGAEVEGSTPWKALKAFWNFHRAEGNEAIHLVDALEMAAWDQGYQNRPLRLNTPLAYLAKILRVDVHEEWAAGARSRGY